MNYDLIPSRRKQAPLRIVCAVTLVFFLTVSPLTVYAQEVTPNQQAPVAEQAPAPQTTTPLPEPITSPPVEQSITTPPPKTEPKPEQPAAVQGPTSPTGAESTSYKLNPDTGLYENTKYTWDPVTKQTKPKEAPTYSYNPLTGMWDTVLWRYDAPTGTYIENKVATPQLPPNAKIVTPVSPSTSLTTDSPSSKNTSSSTLLSNKMNDNKNSGNIFDLFYNASISNTVDSNATTGNALVDGNTLAGNAVSGTAVAMANLINMLQSSWNYMANGGLTTFINNLYGNVFGDITLDPSQVQSNSSQKPQGLVEVNASGSGQITNNVTLNAASGDATVQQNTQAGNANTGDARAIANIVNTISSSVSAGKSFFGIFNIFGNFDGDILLPTSLMNLIQSNSKTTATVQLPSEGSASSVANTKQTITNTIDSTAGSGKATVTDNTSAGNATTGTATTQVNLLNLTGRQVVGQNAMLVFVNVLGKWIGLIVDAPMGSRSAALGDSTTTSTNTPDTQITTSETQSITNNVALSAKSGDATVQKNTTAGDATSGDASTSVNIVNITNSNLSFTDWFGILFINIFGNWNGSFGINTSAGEPSTPTPVSAPQPQAIDQASSVTRQVSSNSFTQNFNRFSSIVSEGNSDVISDNDGKVLSTTSPHTASKVPSLPTTTAQSDNYLFAATGTILGLTILGAERLLSRRGQLVTRQ